MRELLLNLLFWSTISIKHLVNQSNINIFFFWCSRDPNAFNQILFHKGLRGSAYSCLSISPDLHAASPDLHTTSFSLILFQCNAFNFLNKAAHTWSKFLFSLPHLHETICPFKFTRNPLKKSSIEILFFACHDPDLFVHAKGICYTFLYLFYDYISSYLLWVCISDGEGSVFVNVYVHVISILRCSFFFIYQTVKQCS